MSTRSYVGIIEYGIVKYGYHHSDSHLESLGIELFKYINDINSAYRLLKDYAEIESLDDDDTDAGKMKSEEFFNIPKEDICIEFCYGFNIEDNTWYVSSNHFTDASKMYKLVDVVKDDKKMKEYLSCYYEQYRESILKQIRDTIK